MIDGLGIKRKADTVIPHSQKRMRKISMSNSETPEVERSTEQNTAPEGPQTFRVDYMYDKTKIRTRFIKNRNGVYPCVCGWIAVDKASAQGHLASLTEEEKRELHSQSQWENNIKYKAPKS